MVILKPFAEQYLNKIFKVLENLGEVSIPLINYNTMMPYIKNAKFVLKGKKFHAVTFKQLKFKITIDDNTAKIEGTFKKELYRVII